jgi:antiviral helicase SLH1
MRKEPLVYGMSHDEPRDDPQLGNKRNELIVQAARQLSTAKMIRYDEINNSFVISDLGRIAAKYYLKYQTIEIFSQLSTPPKCRHGAAEAAARVERKLTT